MTRKRVRLDNRALRSVLSDMLPFEVPPNFSNRHFYSFLSEHEVEIRDGRVNWKDNGPALDKLMVLLLGQASMDPNKRKGVVSSTVSQWGRTHTVKSIKINECRFDTVPFNFRVSHKSDGRMLSVVHPRNQIMVGYFYDEFASSILYYTSISPFSIRQPVSVSKYSYYDDRTHDKLKNENEGGVEEENAEYEQIGSYFVYRNYSNIHKFFESYKYHRSEKKFNGMLQIDISKCFDSLYTHSIAWATHGKDQTKVALKEVDTTFPGKFDKLLRNVNDKETNGIVIGPEFSRIFAEVILQAADVEIELIAKRDFGLKHKVDYEVFRYVDDYFIFFNDISTANTVAELIHVVLGKYKLHINPKKSNLYEKPIITAMTIAKDRVSSLLNAEIWSEQVPCDRGVDELGDDEIAACYFATRVDPNRLIVKLKTLIKETGVSYSDILNYTFAVTERKLLSVMGHYASCVKDHRSQKSLVRAMDGIIEFMFFAYAASPRVNHTIRLVRALAAIVDFFNLHAIGFELKHSTYKFIHDNVVHQLEKNRVEKFKEVENLYLLNALSHIGREYWLPATTLAEYFGVVRGPGGTLERSGYLNHFSITVGLAYMRDKQRYAELRSFFEEHALLKLEHLATYCDNSAECIMLLLDLVCCPYVDGAKKQSYAAVFGLTATDLAEVTNLNQQWFTTWDGFNLTEELDAKRSREVY